ncbi:MAG: hypothetical protein JWN69_186 [Alphaproteobacteria bacterium]|nr:hypothetical protein [Alphaproteobacteria bacterium]
MMTRIKVLLALARDTARLMVGVPSYQAYRLHRAERHPGAPVMSETEFFRNRQEARYGSGTGRCC